MQNAHDVLVGDVWLCSGQSNMEFAVRGALNGRAEIAASANDNMRQVKHSAQPAHRSRARLSKRTAGMEGREPGHHRRFLGHLLLLRARARSIELDVPQGLVVSAWGGSKIEPWMSEAALRAVGGYEAALDIAGEYRANPRWAHAHWGEYWKKWWLAQPATRASQPWAHERVAMPAGGARRRPSSALGELGRARTGPLRRHGLVSRARQAQRRAGQAGSHSESSAWSMKSISPSSMAAPSAARPAAPNAATHCRPELLKAGDNLVVVNVLDTYASGGMYGPADKRILQLARWHEDSARRMGIPEGAPTELLPPRAPWEPTAGIGHAVQRHDRAARQVWFSRRGLVPG